MLSSKDGKNTTPVLACSSEGCFVAWDDEKAGASVAFVDKDKGQMLWRRDLPAKVVRPAVAAIGNAGGDLLVRRVSTALGSAHP
ncbi:MAG: hypothetical protein WDO74_10140 [Pseudomonadota bacterium]